jgi:NTP pyrophosphatase (non-canonical NTP hydrolase)
MRKSATSEWVLQFAEAMEQKLSENRHKGDREGWLRCDTESLLARVDEELAEVRAAIASGEPPHAVLREAADVANMIAMVADVYAQHYEMPAPGKAP